MQRPDTFGARCDPVSISVQFHNELLRMKIRKELSLQEFTGSNLTLYIPMQRYQELVLQ